MMMMMIATNLVSIIFCHVKEEQQRIATMNILVCTPGTIPLPRDRCSCFLSIDLISLIYLTSLSYLPTHLSYLPSLSLIYLAYLLSTYLCNLLISLSLSSQSLFSICLLRLLIFILTLLQSEISSRHISSSFIPDR